MQCNKSTPILFLKRIKVNYLITGTRVALYNCIYNMEQSMVQRNRNWTP